MRGQGGSTHAHSGSVSPCGQDLAKAHTSPRNKDMLLGIFAWMQITRGWARKPQYAHGEMCVGRGLVAVLKSRSYFRETGQGFKWSLHLMQVSSYRSIDVFVELGFRGRGLQALWPHLWTSYCFYRLRCSVTQYDFQHEVRHLKMTSISRAVSRHSRNRQMSGLELAAEQLTPSRLFSPACALPEFHGIRLALCLHC